MKSRYWLVAVCLMSLAAVSFAGDIQVLCDPGLRVFLDNELVGTSNVKDDGMYLMDVPRGTHIIRVEKTGCIPQVIQVEVSNLPVEVKVEEFKPFRAKVNEMLGRPPTDGSTTSVTKVKKLAGNLTITSAPQKCTVEIDGKPYKKTTPQMVLSGITAGDHTIAFSKDGYDPISRKVKIHPGAEATVRGDLTSGKVELVYEGKGSLRVISKPMRCTIMLGEMMREKIYLRLNLSHLPAGEYPFAAMLGGREVSAPVIIRRGYKTVVSVSFMEGDKPISIAYEAE